MRTARIPRARRPAMARRAYDLKRAGASGASIARELHVNVRTARRLAFSGRWLIERRGT